MHYRGPSIFSGPDGVSHIRKGIIAGVALEPLDGGAILPHEYTLRGPKEDRLELFRACSATASQVFCVYDDPDLLLDDVFASLVSAPPQQVATTEDGVTQKIWWTDDLDIAAAVTQFSKKDSLNCRWTPPLRNAPITRMSSNDGTVKRGTCRPSSDVSGEYRGPRNGGLSHT